MRNSFKPDLECLEDRTVPSAVPQIATQYLTPLGTQLQKTSDDALVRLKDADTKLAAIAAGNVTSDQAATLYAQAAASFQEVLSSRRSLEIAFIADLSFFGGILQTESPADQAADTQAFIQLETQLNTARQKVITNETDSLNVAIVKTGIDTKNAVPAVSNGRFVNAVFDPDNGVIVPVEVTYPPLNPKTNTASPVVIPTYTYSSPPFYNPTGDPSSPINSTFGK